MGIRKLTLEWSRAEGNAQILMLDFHIDGRPLKRLVGGRRALSALGWNVMEYEEEMLSYLLMEKKSDLAGGRAPLYVCEECGDLGCGAIGVLVDRDGDHIVWRDFAWANNYEETHDAIERVGPFRFDTAQYRDALLNPPPRPGFDA